ncbi:MAG: 3-mercaptopyruvate sulfurtransferase [Acidobacteriota bacterium]|nr:3-mercaptopyruvate sulfurtransferase [Acidobacteriota bacterium]
MNPLVDLHWLAARLNDPDTVALDATLPPVGVTPVVDTRARYAASHIPGAVFFDIEELSDHASGLPHTLPSPEVFARKMSALGIGDAMTLVVYEQTGVFSAPRAWWMLRTFGAANAVVLDGDLSAWIAAGLPTDAQPVARPPAAYHATVDRGAVADYHRIQELLAAGGQILDARSAARFAGTAPEPRPGLSSGHMPGSTSVPFTELLTDGRWKDSAALRELFQAKQVDLSRPITTTCGSGVTAAVVALGLELAGARSVSLYDGSWAEYAQKPDAVIQKS